MTLYMNKYKNATVQKKKDISEGIDVNKTSVSKECDICHYWFFKNAVFKFEEHVCNRCRHLLTMTYSLKIQQY